MSDEAKPVPWWKQWLVPGALLAILGAAVSWGVASAQVADLREAKKDHAAKLSQHGETIAVLVESKKESARRMRSIEAKLDAVVSKVGATVRDPPDKDE